MADMLKVYDDLIIINLYKFLSKSPSQEFIKRTLLRFVKPGAPFRKFPQLPSYVPSTMDFINSGRAT